MEDGKLRQSAYHRTGCHVGDGHPRRSQHQCVAHGFVYVAKGYGQRPTRSASYNDQLPYTPENSGSANRHGEYPWVNIGYSLTACGERYSMATTRLEYRMSPYAEHSVTASHEFVLRHCRLSLSASIPI